MGVLAIPPLIASSLGSLWTTSPKTERPSTIPRNILGVITAVLARYTYRLFRATADLARDTRTASDAALTASTEGLLVARSALAAANRAWIHSPEITVGSAPLIFYPRDRAPLGAQASVAIRISNVGNAPAIKLTTHVRMIVLRTGVSPAQEQARLADELKGDAFGPGGRTLFPKEVYPDNIGVSEVSYAVHASREELDAALDMNPGSGVIALYIIGCIDYTFPADSVTHHQTGFVRELCRKGPHFLQPNAGDIPSADLVIRHSFMNDARPAD
jgi:hypothetical protein